jgi:hypothetical protein
MAAIKDFSPGDNLAGNPNIDFLIGSDMQDLVNQLRQLNMPYKILSSHTIGTRPAVILSLTKPIKKIKKEG